MTRQRKFDEAHFRGAVMTRALQMAKNAVRDQIRARGERIANYAAKDITILAEAYLRQNAEQLVTKAAQDVMTFWPEFSWYFANINISAQPGSEPISTTSALQISGAK